MREAESDIAFEVLLEKSLWFFVIFIVWIIGRKLVILG